MANSPRIMESFVACCQCDEARIISCRMDEPFAKRHDGAEKKRLAACQPPPGSRSL